MTFEKSDVMKEFMKIMAAKDPEKFKVQENPYQEDKKTIEEKRIPAADKDMVEVAHPEPVYVAESRGEGGLVENQNEQHKKMMDVINKMPTGSLLGTYASTIDVLVKMANACDEIEENDTANLLTDTAEKIAALIEPIPFEKAPAK